MLYPFLLDVFTELLEEDCLAQVVLTAKCVIDAAKQQISAWKDDTQFLTMDYHIDHTPPRHTAGKDEQNSQIVDISKVRIALVLFRPGNGLEYYVHTKVYSDNC